MIEVFKTNVEKTSQASELISLLLNIFPRFKINFDLEDCDRILRIQGDNIACTRIIELISTNGYQCQVLED